MSGKRSRLPRTKPADDGGDPWHRTDYDDRNHRRDRQRSSFQKGKRVRLAWHRPGRIYHRWQAKAARDSQTWELLLAKAFRARGSRRPATEREAIFRSEGVPLTCRRCVAANL